MKQLFIESTSGSDLDTNAPNLIINNPIPNPRDAYQFFIQSVTVPNSWYELDSTNNFFSISEGGITYSFSIDSGNYSITDLLTAIETVINATLNNTYDLAYNSNTDRISWTVTAGSDTWRPISSSFSLLTKLGFGLNQYTAEVSTMAVVSNENATCIYKTSILKLVCPELSKSGIESISKGNKLYGVIETLGLPTYSVPGDKNKLITWNINKNCPSFYLSPGTNITQLTFYFADQNNRLIDFRKSNLGFNIHLIFYTH